MMSLSPSESSAIVDLGFVQLGYLKVIFLGIVQGITELLPISSTAHLRIVPSLLGWQDPGTVFSAAMQLASFGAVIAYFWKDLKNLTTGSITALAKRDYQNPSFRLSMGLVIGTIPIAIAGLLLKPLLNMPNSPFRSLTVIGISSIVMALLLAAAERFGTRKRDFSKLSFLDGLWVGIAQAFALIPGVSRSGSTLTTGLFLNMERETAARFSFLLGLPAITLAGLVEIHALSKAGLDAHGFSVLMVGLLSATVSAFAAIFGLLRYLEKRSTWIFIWYRLAMGIFLLVGSALNFFH